MEHRQTKVMSEVETKNKQKTKQKLKVQKHKHRVIGRDKSTCTVTCLS